MEKGNKMGNVTTRIITDKLVPGLWRVTLNHPPINTLDDQMYDEIFDLVEAIVGGGVNPRKNGGESHRRGQPSASVAEDGPGRDAL
jgi:hypothetical protein